MSIEVRHVHKSFGTPPTHVLKDISFRIGDQEFVSLTGRSGSGKSTLLYVLSTLDQASSGNVLIDGNDISQMSSSEIHRFRNQHMGFVFQFHYLLPELTAFENVLMPAHKNGLARDRRPYAEWLLENFGLKEKFDRLPSQLSGGEQQRVAIARALVMEPRILFADEPTGNLDSANGEIVMNIFSRFNREKKMAIVMVTHEPDFAQMAERQLLLVDGRLESDSRIDKKS